MYADDRQIYHTGRDQSSVRSKFRNSARRATKRYDSNLLAGNLKKYQTIIPGSGEGGGGKVVLDTPWIRPIFVMRTQLVLIFWNKMAERAGGYVFLLLQEYEIYLLGVHKPLLYPEFRI